MNTLSFLSQLLERSLASDPQPDMSALLYANYRKYVGSWHRGIIVMLYVRQAGVRCSFLDFKASRQYLAKAKELVCNLTRVVSLLTMAPSLFGRIFRRLTMTARLCRF